MGRPPEEEKPAPVRSGPKKKKIPDPNKPKRGMSPFLYFAKEARAGIMQAHPEWKFVDVQKHLSKLWQAMNDAEQQPFKDISIGYMTS